MSYEYRLAEIYPGLVTCTQEDLNALLRSRPDAIAVLDRLPACVWEEGFDGELLYYPIAPWATLPVRVLERLAGKIAALVQEGRHVAIYSREDSGRISYVAACALCVLGVREPINHLRRRWRASDAQRSAVNYFCLRHALNRVQIVEHIQIDDLDAFQQDEDIRAAYTRIDAEIGEEARFLLRFSGQLPSVKIMVEAANPALCEQAINDFIDVVKLKGHYVGAVKER